MQRIVLMIYGSHLYGTATEYSDHDYKGIFLPTAHDILLQRIQPVIITQRKKKSGEKNTAVDVDYELYSPAKFFSLLCQGQMVALDMLFAPKHALLETSSVWESIQALAPTLLTKEAASFVSYCRMQANKYSMKGARIETAERLLDILIKAEEHYGSSAKLSRIATDLEKFAETNIFLKVALHETGNDIPYFEIGGKKALFTSSIKTARSIVQNVLKEYGDRARLAAMNEGIDWKALSHAVRIGHQALEFLKYGHITFPRPEAKHLLAIKQGKIPFEQVSQEIEELVTQVELAKQESSLPDTYDQKILDNFIEQLYLEQVKKAYP